MGDGELLRIVNSTIRKFVNPIIQDLGNLLVRDLEFYIC